ncbi:hypothetical protein Bca4012_088576 [Brassica carinata]
MPPQLQSPPCGRVYSTVDSITCTCRTPRGWIHLSVSKTIDLSPRKTYWALRKFLDSSIKGTTPLRLEKEKKIRTKTKNGEVFDLISLILLPLISVVEGNLGGWKPIDLSDLNIQSLANYAIIEHNMQSKANLVFVKIVEGKEQVVTGKRYGLTIAAKDGGGATKNYEAIVVERPWDHYRSLESFKAL